MSAGAVDGEIPAFGTMTGHRVVLGGWLMSPLGVMLEEPEGTGEQRATEPLADAVIPPDCDYREIDECESSALPLDAHLFGHWYQKLSHHLVPGRRA